MKDILRKIRPAPEDFRGWSWFKKTYAAVFGLGFIVSSFLFLTPPGENIREQLAKTVITTQHRDWAWIFVGKDRRDEMVEELHLNTERMGAERQNFGLLKLRLNAHGELIHIEDIEGKYWKGKKMYVYDPRSIRVVVPEKTGQGERITSMVERTGALAGINGGGFIDPDGLGNGFAPIGFIMSGGEVLITDRNGSKPQHVVGFTKEGALVVGKYSIVELLEMKVTEAVMFYPRVIANGKPLITEGDGGWGRGPRTAIGQKADGTVVIMVIDGRQSHSVGATLKEIQDLMLEEGVINAGFLDGGASSEMVTREDGLITNPSSRYGERRLPSALLIFEDPSSYIANNPWTGLKKIDPGGKYDHPEYLKEHGLSPGGKKTTAPASTPKPTVKPSPTPKPSPAETDNSTDAPNGQDGPNGAGTTSPGDEPGSVETEAPADSSPASPPASATPSAAPSGSPSPAPTVTPKASSDPVIILVPPTDGTH